jgi:thiosulfate dehydrogenase
MNAQGAPSGGPPPAGHQVFKDLQSYFYFLGTGAPLNQMMPGQGYPKVPEPASGHDWRRGEDVYAANCAVCHGEDGEGRRDLNGRTIFPPLWGPRSFNWSAGMHRVNTAAAFIQANMPFGAADSLSDQEAWDVAAYVMSHERPPDPRQLEEDLSVAEAHDRYHAHPGFYGQTVRGEFLDGVPNTTEDELTGREEASTPAETRGAVGKAGGG